MVRVFLKGGVWKNSEDEVLKAAVQKYGKQQWARVASLLNRKTAKQCKARWHEWLDPAIKKTEWSREEEEQLLELAKVMPAQWKTIAPIVGRTAMQCQEHYEYLLDQAAANSAAAQGGEDPSALRPGQIDAHPESKPAKPDPVDMEDEDLEMLQEARARLANTVGKKAKRKQRERMLLAAKRLADLQKKRELKQAGILVRRHKRRISKKKQRQEIDYAEEIPFYKPAPIGFHDVTEEKAKTNALQEERMKKVDFKQVNENQYRTRDKEAAAAEKREQNRLRILESSNEQYAKQKEEQELPAVRREPLRLPAPLVFGGASGFDDASTVMTGSTTRTTRRDLVQEASNQREFERNATPLLLAATVPTPMDVDEDDELLMPPPPSRRDDNSSIAMSSVFSLREKARHDRKAAKVARARLAEALKKLPTPQFEYELQAPPETSTDDGLESGSKGTPMILDQAEVDRARELEAAKRVYRTSVVQRPELPRPPPLKISSGDSSILKEMAVLIQHDAHEYPLPKHPVPPKIELEHLEGLEEAKLLVAKECKDAEQSNDIPHSLDKDSIYVPSRGWVADPSQQDRIASLRHEFELLQKARVALSKQNAKRLKKLTIKTNGYVQRGQQMHDATVASYESWQSATIEEAVFEKLQTQELTASTTRLGSLRADIQQLRATEAALQKRYGALVVDQRRKQQSIKR